MVKLTIEQEFEAAREGWERQVYGRTNCTPRYRGAFSLWGGNIEGACAELAVSLHLDLPWTGKGYRPTPGSKAPPDVGQNVEVKWVGFKPMLRVESRDDLDRVFFLVTGFAPDFEILGRIRGHRASELGSERVFPERTVWELHPARLRAA